MLQFKLLFGVVSLMLVVGFAGAKQIPTSDKNVEQTYVIEPSNNWEATTIIPADIPPLIEGEPSAQVDAAPDANVNTNSNSNTNTKDTTKLPDGSIGDYAYGQYYPPNLYYYPQYQAYPPIYQSPQPYLPQANGKYDGTYASPPSYMPPSPPQNVPATQYDPTIQNVPIEYTGVIVPLIPPPPPAQEQQPQSKDHKILPPRNSYDLAVLLQTLLPPGALQALIALTNFVLNSFSMMAFVAAIGSAICSLTPICQLLIQSLPLGLQRKFTNSEGLNTFQRVRRSIDMYEEIQKGISAFEKSLTKKSTKN